MGGCIICIHIHTIGRPWQTLKISVSKSSSPENVISCQSSSQSLLRRGKVILSRIQLFFRQEKLRNCLHSKQERLSYPPRDAVIPRRNNTRTMNTLRKLQLVEVGCCFSLIQSQVVDVFSFNSFRTGFPLLDSSGNLSHPTVSVFIYVHVSNAGGYIQRYDRFVTVADPGEGKSGHGPHRSWQWSLAPIGGRKSNDSIVNLSKCKDFAPLVSMSATNVAPIRKKKNTTLKHEKVEE